MSTAPTSPITTGTETRRRNLDRSEAEPTEEHARADAEAAADEPAIADAARAVQKSLERRDNADHPRLPLAEAWQLPGPGSHRQATTS